MFRTVVLSLCLLAPMGGMAASLQALKSGDLAAAWLIRDKDAPSLKVSLYVLTGERDGTGAEGLAHFVEHLAWENMSDKNAAPKAGHSNAFTSTDLMAYWLSGQHDQLDTLLTNLLRVLQPLQVSEKFALEEREIIQREYDYRERENWRAGAWQGIMRRLHAADPRRRDVGGSPESIDGYRLEQGARLHRETHTPPNAVLVIRGDLSKRTANRALKKTLGKTTAKHKPIPRSASADYRMAATARDVQPMRYKGVTQPELLYAKVVQLQKPVAIPQLLAEAELLSLVLNSRLEGGLTVPLHYDNFYANDFNLDISVIDAQHLLMYIEAVPDAGIDLNVLLQAVEDELNKSAQMGVESASLDKVKKRLLDGYRDEDQARLQATLVREYLALRTRPIDIKKMLKNLRAVTVENLSQRLRTVAGEGRVISELVQ